MFILRLRADASLPGRDILEKHTNAELDGYWSADLDYEFKECVFKCGNNHSVIGDKMGLSKHVVRNYCKSTYQKMKKNCLKL